MPLDKCLNILGVRGIPAGHGGFESFVTHFAPFMRDAGWKVTVYCQGDEGTKRPKTWEDEWEGIRRIHFETRTRSAFSTIEFDLKCALHVLKQPGIDLVLGYNTAVFNVLQRMSGRRVIMNMDGIEWKRQKWGKLAKMWFWINEWIGAHTCSVPIADHPEIASHLAERGCDRSVVIPYGSEAIEAAPIEPLETFGLVPKGYFLLVARIEPENSILEIVEAFVEAHMNEKLVVLGKLEPRINRYHAKVQAAANGGVIFPGAIYDRKIVVALRFHCLAYMHGHQVGGTNPSLVEALGAGNPIIAHDNKFNRWAAGEEQLFFKNVKECSAAMRLASTSPASLERQSHFSREIHKLRYNLSDVHFSYLNVINDW